MNEIHMINTTDAKQSEVTTSVLIVKPDDSQISVGMNFHSPTLIQVWVLVLV